MGLLVLGCLAGCEMDADLKAEAALDSLSLEGPTPKPLALDCGNPNG
ncbi:MAG: hypothetical protein MUC50_21750 [Myxococcota bacterium]|jgi:hypothetical protein|nr:hypothetical protein [Myxococcota bacterium]